MPDKQEPAIICPRCGRDHEGDALVNENIDELFDGTASPATLPDKQEPNCTDVICTNREHQHARDSSIQYQPATPGQSDNLAQDLARRYALGPVTAGQVANYIITNYTPKAQAVQGDGWLRSTLLKVRDYGHSLAKQEFDDDPLDGMSPIDAEAAIQAQFVAVRKQTASDIFSLAHEYARDDKTMVGSEELRSYHYYNAISKIGEFDGR